MAPEQPRTRGPSHNVYGLGEAVLEEALAGSNPSVRGRREPGEVGGEDGPWLGGGERGAMVEGVAVMYLSEGIIWVMVRALVEVKVDVDGDRVAKEVGEEPEEVESEW